MPSSKYVKTALSSIAPGDDVVVLTKKDDLEGGKNVTARGWMIGKTFDWEASNKRSVARKTADAIASEVASNGENY
jgi:hypothetical protein